jgi:uncharacterized protein (TIGR00251 family)
LLPPLAAKQERIVLDLKEHPEGCILPVRAQPGARRAGILGEYARALRVAVTTAPEQGKANKALVETLSDALGVKKGQIELLSGETSRDKRFLIRGLSVADLSSRLGKVIPSVS